MRTRKMTDRMLLEGLVNKYGKNNIVKAINEIVNTDMTNFSTNWGKTNEDDKNYYVRNENNKDEIFDAAVILFFVKGSKNEIYWRDVNAEYEYGDEYYSLINYICKCLHIKNDNKIDIVKQAYRGIDTLADLFNYNFDRLQKFVENNKEIDYSDFYEDMHYLYANKAYDVLLNTFGNI